MTEREAWALDNGDLLWNVHPADTCLGPCPIHNPSDHHMRDWPLDYRADRGIFERMCPHRIGHPDPDSIAFLASILPEEDAEAQGVHGCDGCCSPPA